MDLGEIERVVNQSANKLLHTSSPPVRCWLLTQVTNRDKDDVMMDEAIRQCEAYPPKVKLLDKLREDGTWPIPKHKKVVEDAGPGPPIGWTYRTILWNLSTLADYRTTRAESHVEAALQNILKWQCKEGYIPGPWTDVFPLPYFNGYASNLLLRFGLEEDKRVQRLLNWLVSMQRPDGGWNIPYLDDLRYLPEYRWMKMNELLREIGKMDKLKRDPEMFAHIPSCHWSTMLVVWGLIDSPRYSKSKEVRRGAEFFLDRFFKRNSHTSYYLTEKHWTSFRYPIRFGNGLMALDILTRLGYGPDDSRMDKPISWLVGARSPDGLWSQSQRPHPERDQWISLIALRSLARYVQNR